MATFLGEKVVLERSDSGAPGGAWALRCKIQDDSEEKASKSTQATFMTEVFIH